MRAMRRWGGWGGAPFADEVVGVPDCSQLFRQDGKGERQEVGTVVGAIGLHRGDPVWEPAREERAPRWRAVAEYCAVCGRAGTGRRRGCRCRTVVMVQPQSRVGELGQVRRGGILVVHCSVVELGWALPSNPRLGCARDGGGLPPGHLRGRTQSVAVGAFARRWPLGGEASRKIYGQNPAIMPEKRSGSTMPSKKRALILKKARPVSSASLPAWCCGPGGGGE